MSTPIVSPETLAYYQETFDLTAEQTMPEVLFDEASLPGGISVHAMRYNGNHIGLEVFGLITSYAALPHQTGETTTDCLLENRISSAASPIGKLLIPRSTIKTGTIREMTIERVAPTDMTVNFIKLGKNDKELTNERAHVIIRARSTVGPLAVGVTTMPIETTRRYRSGGTETSMYVTAFAGTLPTTAMAEYDMRRQQARDRQAIAMTNTFNGGRVSPR